MENNQLFQIGDLMNDLTVSLDVLSWTSWYTTMVFCGLHSIELRCRPCKYINICNSF